MARKRTLAAPSADELAAIEAELKQASPPLRAASAPIAHVAAEVASARNAEGQAARLAQARDGADAAAWRAAEGQGRIITALPLDRIDLDHVVRDRLAIDPEEMAELKASLRASGQRLPVEVVALPDGRFGLISGWRRATALGEIAAEAGTPASVLAVIREGRQAAAIYAGMVEENEIRAQLAPYERGRIAAVAAGQGAFASVDDAVDVIFAAASKAKRSKIRGFALVHEMLGDLLRFPAALTERQGLALAQALRAGQGEGLRAALAQPARDAAEESRALQAAMVAPAPADPARGGRPRSTPSLRRETLPSGAVLEYGRGDDGLVIRASGTTISGDLFQRVLAELRKTAR